MYSLTYFLLYVDSAFFFVTNGRNILSSLFLNNNSSLNIDQSVIEGVQSTNVINENQLPSIVDISSGNLILLVIKFIIK